MYGAGGKRPASLAGYQTLTISSRYGGVAVHGLARERSIRCRSTAPTGYGPVGAGNVSRAGVPSRGRACGAPIGEADDGVADATMTPQASTEANSAAQALRTMNDS